MSRYGDFCGSFSLLYPRIRFASIILTDAEIGGVFCSIGLSTHRPTPHSSMFQIQGEPHSIPERLFFANAGCHNFDPNQSRGKHKCEFPYSKHFHTPLFSRFGPSLLPVPVFPDFTILGGKPKLPNEGTKSLNPRMFALRHLVYMKSVRLIIWWATGDGVSFKS